MIDVKTNKFIIQNDLFKKNKMKNKFRFVFVKSFLRKVFVNFIKKQN